MLGCASVHDSIGGTFIFSLQDRKVSQAINLHEAVTPIDFHRTKGVISHMTELFMNASPSQLHV
jgi:hypothetical protein